MHRLVLEGRAPELAAYYPVLRALDALGASATAESPLAYLTMEPPPGLRGDDLDVPVTLRTWPGGQARVLGHARPHGLPVTWIAAT